jgi:PRTRC genetic system protein C
MKIQHTGGNVNTYPEVATAAIEGPTPGTGSMQYTFVRAIGAKG